MAQTEDHNSLSSVCRRHGVPKAVEADLELQAGHLRIFKTKLLPQSNTESQRAKSLQKIELLAIDLKREIELLGLEDRDALDNQYFFDSDIFVFRAALDRAENTDAFDLAGYVLPKVEVAAQIVRSRLKGAGLKSRPKVTERQADYVRCIAQVLMRANVIPAYSGAFFELCTATFAHAGLTLPDRAIRYFMQKIRPQIKASGRCL